MNNVCTPTTILPTIRPLYFPISGTGFNPFSLNPQFEGCGSEVINPERGFKKGSTWAAWIKVTLRLEEVAFQQSIIIMVRIERTGSPFVRGNEQKGRHNIHCKPYDVVGICGIGIGNDCVRSQLLVSAFVLRSTCV